MGGQAVGLGSEVAPGMETGSGRKGWICAKDKETGLLLLAQPERGGLRMKTPEREGEALTQLHHFPAVWPWASHLTTLGLVLVVAANE